MPLRHLFLDMNSFFASCEQQFQPALRGQPVAVVPVLADTTCCIAASYEAKRRGVKTGMVVYQAKAICPGLRVVKAHPHRYIDVHHDLTDAVQTCVPKVTVRSIDELVYRLPRDQQPVEAATRLAEEVKLAVRRKLGDYLTCSVGLGPNETLAKVAADMKKPDGLTVIAPEELPGRLHPLELTDFPGIGPRMERRFHRFGVYTVRQLCEKSAAELGLVWGSKWIGSLWHHRLRGDDVPEQPTKRRTLGHSHILPPVLRTEAGARATLFRLVEKAAARLRHIGYTTESVAIAVSYRDDGGWWDRVHIPASQDTNALLRVTADLWAARSPGTPFKVGVVFADLKPCGHTPASLFAEDRQWLEVSRAMDRINRMYGKYAVYFAGMHAARDRAPTRIAFTTIPDRTLADA